jgi:hypothetical protein
MQTEVDTSSITSIAFYKTNMQIELNAKRNCKRERCIARESCRSLNAMNCEFCYSVHCLLRSLR